jgi:hypothetical protein
MGKHVLSELFRTRDRGKQRSSKHVAENAYGA